MEYDRSGIPSRFDSGRTYSSETAAKWMSLVTEYAPKAEIYSVVDLGAGTGRFSRLLAQEYSGAQIVAVEPSKEMLAEARGKLPVQNITFVEGRGESIPTADESADLVFASMILHHLASLPDTARESFRVLRSGGVVCIRNSTKNEIPAFGRVYDLLRKRIEAEFPGRDEVIASFTNAGFELVENIVIPQELSSSWTAYIDKAKTKSDSMIARLTDEEFADFQRALEAYAAEHRSQPVIDNIDFFVFRKP